MEAGGNQIMSSPVPADLGRISPNCHSLINFKLFKCSSNSCKLFVLNDSRVLEAYLTKLD